MNRKFLMLALLAVFAIVSLGIVFASDDNTVKVSGVEFHIPDGYHIDNQSATRVYLKNDNGQTCSIEVTPNSGGTPKLFGNEETLGGKQGVSRDLTSTSTGEKSFSFMYNEDSHFITIHAPDRATVEAIIFG